MPSTAWITHSLRSANPYWRLAAAVCISAMLHAMLLLGVRVGEVERSGLASRQLHVRIANVEPSGGATNEEQQPVLVRAIDKPAPRAEPAPLAQPEPRPEPQPEPREAALPQPATPSEAAGGAAKPGMPEEAAGATTLDVPLPEDTNYYPAREVDEHPSLVSGGRPVYPEKAAQADIRGEVTVLMLLNEQGTADEISIVDAKPAGHGFEEAVIAWLRDAHFKPAMRKGRAVKARVVYHVTFAP